MRTLSPMQAEILRMISKGKSDKEIAGEKGRSASTIKAHVRVIMLKLGARSRSHAVWLWTR